MTCRRWVEVAPASACGWSSAGDGRSARCAANLTRPDAWRPDSDPSAGRVAARVPMSERLFGLRGAVSVERNETSLILAATEELMRELIARNALVPDAVVSCIFTATNDLDAQFPAVAARGLGFERVPLLCAREIAVPGSLPRVIRVLIHHYAAADHVARHVYLGETKALRADLDAAQ
jgi:chorismate mutase